MGEQPFYKGQRVVAVISHSSGIIKEGEIYTVTGIYKSSCNCGVWGVSVGIVGRYKIYRCRCGGKSMFPSREVIFGHPIFAPIQEGFKAVSFTKVLE